MMFKKMMKNIVSPGRLMAVMVAVLAWAAPLALASEQEGGAHPEKLIKPETAVPAIIGTLIMFGLLFWLLKKFAWGLILQGLQDREVKIRTEIESAENARMQANAALDEYQKELAKARSEANQMISQAKAVAKRAGDELRSQNEKELASMKVRARDDIESAKRQALSDIYAQTSALSTMIAGKILQREISETDHARLVEESLEQLEALSDNSGGNTTPN